MLISGFGFFHLFFSFLSNNKSFKALNAKLISFDIALMISGMVFLLIYYVCYRQCTFKLCKYVSF